MTDTFKYFSRLFREQVGLLPSEYRQMKRLGEAVKAMAALSFTLPGLPLIYSGQEGGLDHRLQFFEKDEISWDDLSMQDFYRELADLKHDNPALWNGKDGGPFHALEATEEQLLAFERTQNGNVVIVIMNLSAENVNGVVSMDSVAGTYHAYPEGTEMSLSEEHSVELGPWEYRIYTK
ncbi:alpha-glucosidase C-terminal domain-containing protein [Fontibacillus phaseoli]|nr:alpha-glucosidase C-terminal domain-containing protein [Fontibacillus phaseoli]